MQQKQQACEETELTLLQLHQVQEELEQYFLKAQDAEGEVASMKEQLVAQVEELQQAQTVRDELSQQKQEACEEAELTLLQLHQVQEELENYFIKSQSAEQLAMAQQNLLLRAQSLMVRVLPEAAANPLDQGLEVELLPPLTPAAGVQTEALLSSYASSLHRAASLLQRAMQR